MEIVEATNTDIPEIIDVLKASLGETSSQKTEAVWNFKHVNNPFGKSLVLVAKEESKIIGVRALMRWQWQKGNDKFSALRAVDTATLPDHRGKGVFKKLTLKAVDIAKSNNDQFIFNTPNSQSRPGYLKMGWEQVGKIELSIMPANPLNFFKKEKFKPSVDQKCSDQEFGNLLDEYNLLCSSNEKYFTPKTKNFLEWRYNNNELQDYQVVIDKDYYLASYLKDRGKLNELRISEFIFLSSKGKKKGLKKINRLASQSAANFISFANKIEDNIFSIHRNFGPILTVKKLDISQSEFHKLFDLENWNYSLGDLELF